MFRDEFSRILPSEKQRCYGFGRNNHGPFRTDNIGRNYDYPEAS